VTTTPTPLAPAAATAPPTRQPRALYYLFFTEMWERFSFYGMQALLLLYMMKHLHFGQARASSLLGWYAGLAYLTPLFGGMLADRRLGYRRTILIGGTLMMIGHFLMAIDSLPIFFTALILLILGNGGFKANISTVVGKLYPPGDRRRDRGFTIVYMGINLGALISPLICGYLADHVGWHYGFAAAGVGMAIGLVTFLAARRALEGVDLEAPARAQGAAERTSGAPLTRQERGRVLVLILVSFFVVLFWAGYIQTWDGLTLWADVDTDRHVLGYVIPSTWFQSVNPLFVIALSPVLSMVWAALDRRGREPSTPMKMVLGLLGMALCFGLMTVAAAQKGSGQASAWWLVGCYLLMSLGELTLSPVGLSFFSQVAPTRMSAMMMGVWFLAIMSGYKLGGFLGEGWEKMSHLAFFALFAGISLAAAAVFVLLLRKISRMMHGAE
jgi:POT family proton-dependent oligopeptide transporter